MHIFSSNLTSRSVASFLFLSLLFTTPVIGAENSTKKFSDFQKELKEKDPKQYEKIIALAASDMEKARQQLMALAEKHGIKAPEGSRRNSRRTRENGFSRGDRQSFGGFRGERGSRRGGEGGERSMGEFGPPREFNRSRQANFNPFSRIQKENELKAKFPKEVGELQKKLVDSETQLQELAKKANVELPQDVNLQLRLLQQKAPAEMNKILSESSNPFQMMRSLAELAEKNNIKLNFGNRQPGSRRMGDAVPESTNENNVPARTLHVPIRKIREAYPEEMKKYDELRQTDPNEAKKLLASLIAQYGAKK